MLFTAIMKLRVHLRIIEGAGMYRVSKEVYASGREIEESDLIIDDKRHKQFLDTSKALTSMMKERPDKMIFSNANFNVNTVPQHIVVPKDTAKEVVRQKSVFTKTDLTQRHTYKEV